MRARLTKQGEVRPQYAAKKPHTVDFDLVVVEDMDVVWCSGLELIDQGDVVMIKLVVAGHIDDRLI